MGCESSSPCWACRFDASLAHGRVGREVAALTYELAVETVETWPGPFNRADLARRVWELVRRSFPPELITHRRVWPGAAFTYANLAVDDLVRHGLVRCTRRVGRRCMSWEVCA